MFNFICVCRGTQQRASSPWLRRQQFKLAVQSNLKLAQVFWLTMVLGTFKVLYKYHYYLFLELFITSDRNSLLTKSGGSFNFLHLYNLNVARYKIAQTTAFSPYAGHLTLNFKKYQDEIRTPTTAVSGWVPEAWPGRSDWSFPTSLLPPSMKHFPSRTVFPVTPHNRYAYSLPSSLHCPLN